jgi:DNA-binding MarR family transcriptional regulator
MSPQPTAPNFTAKQGQYLAFIYAYTHVLGRPPAEADLQRHFSVSPPSVHQMVLTLERTGLIHRKPGVARSIKLLVHQVSDWCSGAAANFDWMREAKRENTRCGL